MANNAFNFGGGGGGGGSSTSSRNQVSKTQVGHGLSILDVVRINTSGNYVKAQANSSANSEAIAVVESVSGNDLVNVLSGEITGDFSSFTAGDLLFLSQGTAGAVQNTQPSSGIIKHVMTVISSTKAFVHMHNAITL